MQLDGRRISTVADDRDHLTPAAQFALPDQLAEQQPSDAFAEMVRMNVDGIFNRESISRPRTVHAGVSIARHDPMTFYYQVRKAFREHGIATPRNLVRVRWSDLEGRSTMLYMMEIDGADGAD